MSRPRSVLTRLSNKFRRDYDDPTLKLTVIAHSMGGLVTPLLPSLRHGGCAGRRGAPSHHMRRCGEIDTAVLLGTRELLGEFAAEAWILWSQVGLPAG